MFFELWGDCCGKFRQILLLLTSKVVVTLNLRGTFELKQKLIFFFKKQLALQWIAFFRFSSPLKHSVNAASIIGWSKQCQVLLYVRSSLGEQTSYHQCLKPANHGSRKMSLFPDQCVDDILKNGRRRFANHSGCHKLHYDAILLMSKCVPGWGSNRIRGSGSWTQDPPREHSLIFVKSERILGFISENHLSESFSLVYLLFSWWFLKIQTGLHHSKVLA